MTEPENYIRSHIKQLEEQNIELMETVFSYEKQLAMRDGEISKLEEELRLMTQAADAQTNQEKYEGEQDIIDEYARTNDELRTQLDELSTQVTITEEEECANIEEVFLLRRQLEELETAHSYLQNQSSEMHDREDSWVKDVEEMESKSSQLREQVTEFKEEFGKLNAADPFTPLEQAVQSLTSELLRTKEKITALRGNLHNAEDLRQQSHFKLRNERDSLKNVAEEFHELVLQTNSLVQCTKKAKDCLNTDLADSIRFVGILDDQRREALREREILQEELNQRAENANNQALKVEELHKQEIIDCNERYSQRNKELRQEIEILAESCANAKQVASDAKQLVFEWKDNAESNLEPLFQELTDILDVTMRKSQQLLLEKQEMKNDIALLEEEVDVLLSQRGELRNQDVEAELRIEELEEELIECTSNLQSEQEQREEEEDSVKQRDTKSTELIEDLRLKIQQMEEEMRTLRGNYEFEKGACQNLAAKAKEDKNRIDKLTIEIFELKSDNEAIQREKRLESAENLVDTSESPIQQNTMNSLHSTEFKYVETENQLAGSPVSGKSLDEREPEELEQLRREVRELENLLSQIDEVNPNDLYSDAQISKLFARFAINYLCDKGRIEQRERDELLENYLEEENSAAMNALLENQAIRNPRNDLEYMSSKLLIQEHSIANLESHLLLAEDNYEAIRCKFETIILEKSISSQQMELIKRVYDHMEQQLKNEIDRFKEQLLQESIQLDIERSQNSALEQQIYQLLCQERMGNDEERALDYEKAKIIQHYQVIGSNSSKWNQQYKK